MGRGGCAISTPLMKLSVPKETAARERRVALVPDSVKKLVARKLEVPRRAWRGRSSRVRPTQSMKKLGLAWSMPRSSTPRAMSSSRSSRPTRPSWPGCGPG